MIPPLSVHGIAVTEVCAVAVAAVYGGEDDAAVHAEAAALILKVEIRIAVGIDIDGAGLGIIEVIPHEFAEGSADMGRHFCDIPVGSLGEDDTGLAVAALLMHVGCVHDISANNGDHERLRDGEILDVAAEFAIGFGQPRDVEREILGICGHDGEIIVAVAVVKVSAAIVEPLAEFIVAQIEIARPAVLAVVSPDEGVIPGIMQSDQRIHYSCSFPE